MTPKPLPFIVRTTRHRGETRLRKKGTRMTIALGQLFYLNETKCALVCADSRVVATDGATTFGAKLHTRLSLQNAYAIADASDDGNAAKMLAQDITSALCDKEVTHLNFISRNQKTHDRLVCGLWSRPCAVHSVRVSGRHRRQSQASILFAAKYSSRKRLRIRYWCGRTGC